MELTGCTPSLAGYYHLNPSKVIRNAAGLYNGGHDAYLRDFSVIRSVSCAEFDDK